MGLSRQQEGFIQSLLEGKKQVDAYRDNYSCKNMSNKSIYEEASKLRKNPNVSPRYEKLKEELDKELLKETMWSKERLIKEFEEVKKKCMQEVEVEIYDKESCEMVGTGKYVFKENGVIKSLENIGKLCGHYVEQVNHSGEVATTINIVPAKKRDKK